MNKIFLTSEEINLFKEFRKYQDKFEILISNKVFETKNGKAILNFDNKGLLRQVEIHKINWRA